MIRLGQFGDAYHDKDGKLIDNDDVVSGILCLQKGANAQPTLEGVNEKVKQLNDQILPKGVTLLPFIDRSDLLHFTTHTVLHNLTEGMILVAIILFLFLGNVRGATIVVLTIPFSLLFAATCLDLRHIPANLLSLGALDFGMVVDGAVVMVENIVRHLSHGTAQQDAGRKDPRRRPRSAAPGVLRYRHHHYRLSAHLHVAVRGGPAVPAHGVDGGVCAAGRAHVLHHPRSRIGQHAAEQGRKRMEKSGDGIA